MSYFLLCLGVSNLMIFVVDRRMPKRSVGGHAKTQGPASLTSFIVFCDGIKVNALLESVRQPKCAGWRPLCLLA